MEEKPPKPLSRRVLRKSTKFAAAVLAGALSTVLASFFVEAYQEAILRFSPTGLMSFIRAQLNELPEGATRLNVNAVTRIIDDKVTIQALEVGEFNFDTSAPLARIVINVPNRRPVDVYLKTNQEHEFVYRNAKYSVKLVQLMPEDQTADVEILGPRE